MKLFIKQLHSHSKETFYNFETLNYVTRIIFIIYKSRYNDFYHFADAGHFKNFIMMNLDGVVDGKVVLLQHKTHEFHQ